MGNDGGFEVVYAEKGKYPFIYKRGSFVIAVNPKGEQSEAAFDYSGEKIFEIGDTAIADGKIKMGAQSMVIIKLS